MFRSLYWKTRQKYWDRTSFLQSAGCFAFSYLWKRNEICLFTLNPVSVESHGYQRMHVGLFIVVSGVYKVLQCYSPAEALSDISPPALTSNPRTDVHQRKETVQTSAGWFVRLNKSFWCVYWLCNLHLWSCAFSRPDWWSCFLVPHFKVTWGRCGLNWSTKMLKAC